MRSMTGFGHAQRFIEEMDIVIDIKTVNGRYLNLNLRLPKELMDFEGAIRKEIQARVKRGRVEVYLNLTLKLAQQHELNEPLLKSYFILAEKVRALGVKGELDLATIVQLPGVLIPGPLNDSSEKILRPLLEVLRASLDQVIAARTVEGRALKNDLGSRIVALEKRVEEIDGQSSRLSDYHRERLHRRIKELEQEDRVDKNRLAQEVLFYAERSDIAEEITRLQSHIAQFHRYLARPRGDAVGRHLDFLCQEMNREMNTVLSKSPLVEISEIAIEGKAEIGKIREQVQNVE